MMKEKAWSWIEENKEEFIEVSDKVWEYAELGIVSRLEFGVGQGQWTNTEWVGDKVTIRRLPSWLLTTTGRRTRRIA